MSDLFASLAARFGDAPAGDAAALRPRPRARFQPEETPAAELTDETGFDEQISETSAAPLFRTAPVKPVERPVQNGTTQAEIEPAQAKNAPPTSAEPVPQPPPLPPLEPLRRTNPVAEMPVLTAEKRGPVEKAPIIEAARPPVRALAPAEPLPPPTPAYAPEAPPAPAPGVIAAPLRPRGEMPASPRPTPLAPAENDPLAAAPIETAPAAIEIRIGRIEVTAPPPPRPDPVPKTSRTLPKAAGGVSVPRASSLTDYLGWRRR